MRTINLTTFILGKDNNRVITITRLISSFPAPIVVGQIIHYISPEAGAIFIAVWNIISALIEYSLLLQIYKIVPELSIKDGVNDQIPFVKITPSSPDSASSPRNNNNVQIVIQGSGEQTTPENQARNRSQLEAGGPKMMTLSPGPDFEDVSLMTPISTRGRGDVNSNTGPEMEEDNKGLVIGSGGPNNKCLVACHGWKCYVSHHVRFAGLGLSCLYMTVLGFDSITTG